MQKSAILLGVAVIAAAFIAGATAVASNRVVIPGLSGDSAGGSPSATPTVPATPTLPAGTIGPGTWGSIDALLTIEAGGTARMQFLCASAEIFPPLTIDEDGQFAWTGRYTQERPGPVAGVTYDATFAGTLGGNSVHMVIVVPAMPLFEEFDLRRGAPGPGVGCVGP